MLKNSSIKKIFLRTKRINVTKYIDLFQLALDIDFYCTFFRVFGVIIVDDTSLKYLKCVII